jgi:serine protease inhibitor
MGTTGHKKRDMTNALIEELFPENWTLATISELISSNGLFVDGNWIESKDQDKRIATRIS